MALIKCPECGGEVSDKSNVCIHCGYPLIDRNDYKNNEPCLLETMLKDEEMREKILDETINGNKRVDLMGMTLPIGWYF